MAKASKLPSGSWRVLVYSHTDKVVQDDGTIKKIKRYESITGDDEDEVNYLAAQYRLDRKRKKNKGHYTVGEAMDEYIKDSDGRLSPSTIRGYMGIRKNHFTDLMDIKIKDLTNDEVKKSVNAEYKRDSKQYKESGKRISEKTVINAYGLLSKVLKTYAPRLGLDVELSRPPEKVKELPTAETIMRAVYGTDIELPVLMAMWLSYSASELRGLKKSTSISGDYVTIKEVAVYGPDGLVQKEKGKAAARLRKHEIPPRIKELIDQVDGDQIITLSSHAIYMRLSRLLEKNGIPHISFHDLRHLNASVMALLRVPDKYAQERGGWKTDKVMKRVYQHTFSDERNAVDKLVDSYFEEAFSKAVQHRIQHGKEKPHL